MHADPRRQRQEALAGALSAAALDGLLVTSRANIRYLTGFSGSAALVAVTQGDVLLVTDFRYDEQARAEAGAVARVEVESTSVWDRFFKELATLGPLAALGYEAHALTVQDAERFTQAGQAWRWTATKDLVERLRAAKGPGEVAAIRSAAELAGAALRDTLPQVRGGMTEPGVYLAGRSEEHTSELQSRSDLVCRLLLEKKKSPAPPGLIALGGLFPTPLDALCQSYGTYAAFLETPRPHYQPFPRPPPNASAILCLVNT